MQAGGEQPLRVFWSYSHKDETLRDELHEHLAGLRRAGQIADWHDRKIGAGKVWKDEIDRHLGDADVVLLLVSASFMASDYCWGDEMAKALAMHAKGEARVIPVILRPCDWHDTPIARLQAVPKDARPITQWGDRDLAYLDVASAIRLAVRELAALRGGAKPCASAAPSPGASAPPSPASGRGSATPAAERPGEEKKPLPHAGEVGASAPGEGTADAPKSKKLESRVYVGADSRDLPDLAIFKDIDAPWCPEMVIIPAGRFLMGSPEADKRGAIDGLFTSIALALLKMKLRVELDGSSPDRPQHEVKIGSRFAIGRYPLTFAEYDQFCEATQREKPGDEGWGRGRRPVINVSWRDAQDYVAWLCTKSGQRYRLPSESEWEYACRAGTTTGDAFGDTPGEKDAKFNESISRTTAEVGGYPANRWGLFDVHGNVWEWVEDVWHSTYVGAPADGSAWTDDEGEDSSLGRVRRGGSRLLIRGYWRIACRVGSDPDVRNDDLGFRLARTLS